MPIPKEPLVGSERRGVCGSEDQIGFLHVSHLLATSRLANAGKDEMTGRNR